MAISPEAADMLAARLLGDLHTKLGGLEIDHARRVTAAVRGANDDRVIAAALVHDVLEKARISAADPMALLVKRVDLADKLVADDSVVPTVVAERIRQEARERLALLDDLAPS